jgi:beta-glucanase (GH16 family)
MRDTTAIDCVRRHGVALVLLHSLLIVPIAGCSTSIPPGAGGEESGGSSQTTDPSNAGSSASSSDGSGATSPPVSDDAGVPASNDAGHAVDAADTADASDAASSTALPGWTLTWDDEFNLPNGSAVDSTKWTQETGNGGWSTNKEREYYTPGTDNAVLQNGMLVITAKTQGASAYSCEYGTCQYTSARMNTASSFTQKYGRFEARIKIPKGQGMWPAFWMLGDNIGSAGWPQCGEVDIMENVGSTPSTDYGSLHGPGYSGGQDLTGSYSLPDGGALGDDFHVYAVEWAPDTIRFYLDDVNYETRTSADVPSGDTWVYDHPFFLILNVAVGGQWPGDPDDTTQFPQTMQVDYVRVYTQAT